MKACCMNSQTTSLDTLLTAASKYIVVACVLVATLYSSKPVSADSCLISSYANVTSNASAEWYGLVDLGASTTDFQGVALGTFDLATDSLSLTGGQVSTFKGDSSDVFSANLSYRVYPVAGSAPSFSNLNLSFSSNSPVTDAGGNVFSGSGDQKWETLTSIDLLSGLTNGDYLLEVFASASTSDGDKFHSNFGNNYKATFTAVPEPSAFLFGGLVCSILGMTQARKRRRS